MEVAGPLGTPLGLAQRKRASPRGEAGTSPRFDPWKIPWRRRWLFLYRVPLCFQAPPSHTDKDQVLPGLLSWVSLDKERHIGLSKGIQISSISPTTLKSSAVLLLLLCFQSCPHFCIFYC